MLPIVPGCRAVSISGAPDCVGHEFNVVVEIPDWINVDPCCGVRPIFYCYPLSDPERMMKGCNKCMRRIDGGNPDAEQTDTPEQVPVEEVE